MGPPHFLVTICQSHTLCAHVHVCVCARTYVCVYVPVPLLDDLGQTPLPLCSQERRAK